MDHRKKADRFKKAKIRSIFSTLNPLATIQLISLGYKHFYSTFMIVIDFVVEIIKNLRNAYVSSSSSRENVYFPN